MSLISELLSYDLQFGVEYVLNMFEVLDGTFGNSGPGESLWGSYRFTLDDCDSGNGILAGLDGSTEFNFVRLAGLHGSACQ